MLKQKGPEIPLKPGLFKLFYQSGQMPVEKEDSSFTNANFYVHIQAVFSLPLPSYTSFLL